MSNDLNEIKERAEEAVKDLVPELKELALKIHADPERNIWQRLKKNSTKK